MDVSVFSLLGLAGMLGMKHGLDADHLATIDGLTRYNSVAGRTHLARLCGLLFSFGHGCVVCMVAVATGLLFRQGNVPSWLDGFGVLISAFFLLLLGGLNLYAVFATPSDQMVQMVGIKGRWLGQLKCAGNPFLIALVGALFALSFDTLSQAALFSVSAAQYGSPYLALLLAVCFMLGMMLTDALNGLWISHLLRKADATARVASRIMGMGVALLSLLVAFLGLSRQFYPNLSGWQEGRELFIGIAFIAIIAMCFVCARILPRRSPATI